MDYNPDYLTLIFDIGLILMFGLLVVSNLALAFISKRAKNQGWLWFFSLALFFSIEFWGTVTFMFGRLIPNIIGDINTTFTSTLPLRTLFSLISTGLIFYFMFFKKYHISSPVPKKSDDPFKY
jgi:hypothetical protein